MNDEEARRYFGNESLKMLDTIDAEYVRVAEETSDALEHCAEFLYRRGLAKEQVAGMLAALGARVAVRMVS